VAKLLATPLTADAAVRIALLRNSAVQAEYAQLDITSADVVQATRLPNPALGLSILWPAAAGTLRQTDGALTMGLTDLLLLSAHRRQGVATFRAAEQRAAAGIYALALDTQDAWVAAVAANERLALHKNLGSIAELTTDLAQQYREAGNLDALQLAHISANSSEVAIAAGRVASTAAQSRARLRQLLGLGAMDPPLLLPESLPAPTESPLDRSALRTAAHAQRLDLLAVRSEAEAMRIRSQTASRYRWPRSAQIGAISESEGPGTTRRGATATVDLPLFQQGQADATRGTAQLALAMAKLQTMEIAIDAELDMHLEQLGLTQAQYALYRDRLLPQRQAVVAELSLRANTMLVGPFELLAARQLEYQASDGAVESLQEYWQSRVALARTLGAPLPTLPLEVQP
jgi:cobalt-zinc-cadmium efflux system outer membrane protein